MQESQNTKTGIQDLDEYSESGQKSILLGPNPLFEKLRVVEPFFRWVRWFYSHSKGIDTFTLLYYFFPQKVLRINGKVGWPVHFTSRVLYYDNIQAGNNVLLGKSQGCYVQARNGIIAGNNVMIGPGVGILSTNHNVDNYDLWDAADPVVIGDNVMIEMNSVVLPGVTIGDNVWIKPNSVVSQDIPSDSFARGNPCRVIAEKPPYRGKDYAAI